MEDFSCEHLLGWTDNWETPIAIDKGHTPDGYPKATTPKCLMLKLIELLNDARDNFINYEEYAKQIQPDLLISKKDIWWQMIQLLPSSYNQTRNVMMNYEVLTNIYKSRKNHKLDEWRSLCSWIKALPYQELITGETYD